MADRRRINGPPGGTSAPLFAATNSSTPRKRQPQTQRPANELRKVFLKTGVTPLASGSAYLEIQSNTPPLSFFEPGASSLKIACTVHGPKPLPRSAPFSPHLVLSAHVKFAPFATKQRRGYVRDSTERDLAAHLETAMRGAIIGERWPKCGADLIITILESEDSTWGGADSQATTKAEAQKQISGNWGTMSALAGCITVASAALVNAGIDCVDLVTGGIAAIVDSQIVLDPSPSEHARLSAASVVGYLPSRDEITELWYTGDAGTQAEELVDGAVEAANAVAGILAGALAEGAGGEEAADDDATMGD